MDPYYVQQANMPQSGPVGPQPPPLSSRDNLQSQTQMVTGPSAPMGPGPGPMSQRSHQTGQSSQMHHHQQQQQQSAQQAAVQQHHHRSSSGSTGAYMGQPSQPGQQQQSAFMDSSIGPNPSAAMSRQPQFINGSSVQSSGPMPAQQAHQHHHHPHHPQQQQQHGGQGPPLPVAAGAVGGPTSHHHHHSSRYSSHRNAMMHQHRTSAAAISDPMMASTMTDHLAAAADQMTGSGGALNQIGAAGYGPYYSSRDPMAANDPAFGQAPYSAGHHQSRYEAHYGTGQPVSRHHHHHRGPSAGGTSYPAYQFDEASGRYVAEPALGSSGRTSGFYGSSMMHQSLGNLPSITSRLEHQQRAYGLSDPPLMATERNLYPGEYVTRAGSMPPPESGTIGLGSYNPLDDPLAPTTAPPLSMLRAGHLQHDGQQQQQQQHHLSSYQQHAGLGGGAIVSSGGARDAYVMELKGRLHELQNSYAQAKRELETATQKLGSSMHSIKSFWSPELKKERALRKEEATKYALINDQMKLMRMEVQKQALLIRQLEDELRLAHETRLRTNDTDIQQHIDALCMEKENLFKENCILRDTIRELEMRVETQKQTLAARDASIKKMVDMMNNKGIATKIMEDERLEMDRIKTRNIELETRLRHYETIIENKEKDLIKSAAAGKSTSQQDAFDSGQQSTSCLRASLSELALNNQNNANDKREDQHKSGTDEDSSDVYLNLPKSPVPKMRESLKMRNGSNPKQSKLERIKNRLSLAKSSTLERAKANTNKLDQQPLMMATPSSSLSSSSASSSSGVSSSKSCAVSQTTHEQDVELTETSELVQTNEKVQESKGRQDDQQRRDQSASVPNCYQTNNEQKSNEKAASANNLVPNQYDPYNIDTSREVGKSGKNVDTHTSCQCRVCLDIESADFINKKPNYQNENNSVNFHLSDPFQTYDSRIKKAVSFRPSVEHIGSPSYRALNDATSHIDRFSYKNNNWQILQSPRRYDYSSGNAHQILRTDLTHHDSCDSLHVTKDISGISAIPEAAHSNQHYLFRRNNDPSARFSANPHSESRDDAEPLRPLDCSTPKILYDQPRKGTGLMLSQSTANPLQPYQNQDLPPTNKIRAEVHQQPIYNHTNQATTGSYYTCLCAPDANCIHNHRNRYDPSWDVQNNSMTISNPMKAPAPGDQEQVVDDELYARNDAVRFDRSTRQMIATDEDNFPLSSNCVDCTNLSTYVNLSKSPATKVEGADQMRHHDSLTMAGANDSAGYESGEYKQLIRSKQGQVYGNLIAMNSQHQQQQPATEPLVRNSMLDEDYHYLSAARQLMKTLDGCSICSAQIKMNCSLNRQQNSLVPTPAKISDMPECNCPLGNGESSVLSGEPKKRLQGMGTGEVNNDQNMSKSSTYLSASSSFPSFSTGDFGNDSSMPRFAVSDSIGPRTNNSSQLNVLPITQSSHHQQSSSSRIMPLNMSNVIDQTNSIIFNGIDSQVDSMGRRISAHSRESLGHPRQPSTSINLSQSEISGCNVENQLYLNPNSQMDSSLSSLFVYRHMSDDNDQDTDATHHNKNESLCDIPSMMIDPDSLELTSEKSSGVKQQGKQRVKRVFKHPQSQRGNDDDIRRGPGADVTACSSSSSGWLKPRPRSDYISLSSTTSTMSATNPVHGNNSNYRVIKGAKSNTIGGNTNGKQTIQVDPDLSHSTLAKRRQQNAAIKQLQQSGNLSKKKLLASKLASSSSPNINLPASSKQHNEKSAKAHCRSTSSSSSNVKSIYQCVKNHLLDMTSSSSTKSTPSQQQNSSKISVQSLPQNPNLKVQVPGTSNSLGRLPASTTPRRPTKAAQMEELRAELVRRDQEILTMGAKMKALEDQQRDSQRHIGVLKDSLIAKEEHYNLLLVDVEELRRNLDERNKLIEKRSYQQSLGLQSGAGNMIGNVSARELQDMQSLLDMRDKRINELQRKLVQLDNLLAERDAQLDRARMRHSELASGHGYPQQHHDVVMLNHLEETLADKEKQISLLRDQRDRAEHEFKEERDSHERSIKEYKMKIQSLRSEMDKQQNPRFSKSNLLDSSAKFGSDFAATSVSQQLQDQLKRLEMDKRSLQLECDRLRDKLDHQQQSSLLRARTNTSERATSALGSGDYSIVEFERLQEIIEQQKQDLRRAQAECRMNDMEKKRMQDDLSQIGEKYERIQSEMVKLRAKLENANSEREQLLDDYNKQQQLISKFQQERDLALADINQVKLDNERTQQSFNKLQLDFERMQSQMERHQLEYNKVQEKLNDTFNDLQQVQSEKLQLQRELKKYDMNIKTYDIQTEHLKQEKELLQGELEKLRERFDKNESELKQFHHEKESGEQQLKLLKERHEQQQQQMQRLTQEREQTSAEMQELRKRLYDQQMIQDANENDIRVEMRAWKEKYERLLGQFEKCNDDIMNKQKENQILIDKLQRCQNDLIKFETKLEQSEMERERMLIELEKYQQSSAKMKEDNRKWQDEMKQLQEMYTKTNTKLLNVTEVEERLRIDYEKCQMDLEVLRERYERLQLECRKLQQERDRIQVEFEQLVQQSGTNPFAGGESGDKHEQLQSQLQHRDELIRLANAKVEQYQREINKLQLEKERLIIDSKSAIQKCEQQYQQQLLKLKSSEEKLTMELDRTRAQAEKFQSKCGQTSQDQEKLVMDKERLQQQLLLLQQEVDKYRNQQTSSIQETKRLHDDEVQRLLQELETIREKYTQQRKELLQLREMQQNHEIDKDILKRELESAELRLEKLSQGDQRQKQDTERFMIEIEKMKDKIEKKQQELVKTQKERDQFVQEIQVLHKQLQQLQLQFEQQAQQQQQQQQQQQSVQQQQSQKSDQPQANSSGEINKLKQMLVKSENDLQKTMAENQRLQMEVERLKCQLDDAAQYIRRIESDSKTIAQQNSDLIEQMKSKAGGQQPAQQQQQQQPNLQAELERNQQEMKNMQDVIKKSAQEIQRVVEEKKKLLEANKELQRHIEQIKTEFTTTIEQYEAELSRLQKESQQSQPAAQQGDEFKIKFDKAVETIKVFQKKTDEMRKELTKLNELNKNLSDQNQSLARSLKGAEEALAKQQQRRDSSASLGANRKEAADNAAGRADEMQQQVKQLSELCSKLEKDLSKSQEKLQQHLALEQQFKLSIEKSQSDFSNIKTERDRLQAQIEKLLPELERREAEITNLKAQQDKSGQNINTKQNELITYQKQLEEREKALEAKRQELNNLSKQIQQQQQHPKSGADQQNEEIGKLRQQIKMLEDERTKLRGELERVRADLKQAQAELERLLKILSASEEEKFSLGQQIEQLQAKLKSTQTQHAQQPNVPPRGPPGPQTAQNPQQKQAQPQQQPQPRSQPPPQQQQQQQQPRQPPPQKQQPNQGQSDDDTSEERNIDLSLQDNMELLETALMHSIDWSIRNRSTSDHEDAKSLRQANQIDNRRGQRQKIHVNSDLVMNDDSHVRAFVTHFKIELNHLMGIKWRLQNESLDQHSDTTQDNSTIKEDRLNYELGTSAKDPVSFKRYYSDRRPRRISVNAGRPANPSIRLNGKYSGVYNINNQCTTDDDDDSFKSKTDHCTKTKPKLQTDPHKFGSDSAAYVNQAEQLVDDGYRSLSRNSRDSSHFTTLIQQLKDLRSRIIDMTQEIDQLVTCSQNQDDIDAYRRRRDALIRKIDSMIENHKSSNQLENFHPTQESSLLVTARQGSQIYDSVSYEEQVVDFDFRRKPCRRSTIDGLSSHRSDARNSSDLLDIHSPAEGFKRDPSIDTYMKRQTIDFGAMMRNYESKRRVEDVEGPDSNADQHKIVIQHAPSASTTSTCSSSSHISTSSSSTSTSSFI